MDKNKFERTTVGIASLQGDREMLTKNIICASALGDAALMISVPDGASVCNLCTG